MSHQLLPLVCCLSKPYECRHPLDHRLVTESLAPFFPSLSLRKLKLISFFLQVRNGPATISKQHFSQHSFVMVHTSDSPQKAKLHILRQKEIELAEGESAAILDYDKYLTCQALGDTSIDQELSFFESSEYFCSMSRKKFTHLLKEARVLTFAQDACAYFQGQQLTERESGSGIYLVRQGEFGGYRNDGREVEAFRFEKGHVFGALEMMGREGVASSERTLTVRCKTRSGSVYHFDSRVFTHLIRHHCEEVIKQKQSKLLRYLPAGEQYRTIQPANKSRKGSVSMNSSYYPPFSTNNSFYTVTNNTPPAPSATGNSFFSTLKPSQQLQQTHLRKTTYLSLRKQGPLKHYPLVAQTSNFTTSEFRELQKAGAQREKLQTLVQRANRTGSLQKRDVMQSFYRQTLHAQLKRTWSKH